MCFLLPFPMALSRLLLLVAALLWGAASPLTQAQPISLSFGTPYTQNFNTLAASGTSSVVPAGWAFLEAGTNANTTYAASTGSSTAGNTYSFGAAGSPDRAFGGLTSASLQPTIGAHFRNDDATRAAVVTISYTGEQWRLGTAGREDRLRFEYSTNATSLATGTWTRVPALDFASPTTSGPVGARDGNAPANRSLRSSTLGSLLAPGATLWIRWVDLDAFGADDGLAVDDFVISMVEAGSGTATQPLPFNPSAAQGDGAGWRQLAVPVADYTVHDLAQLNLVQGVEGDPEVPEGAVYGPQYPLAPPNVYVTYNPSSERALPNGFVPPLTAAEPLDLGRGFFWYLYDNDLGPFPGQFGGGTSRSYELTTRPLTASGQTPVSNVTRVFADYVEAGPLPRFYMVGNPFMRPLRLSGISVAPGAIQGNVLQIYRPTGPNSGTFMLVDRASPTSFLAVWQGAFVEVATAGDQTVTYAYSQTDPAATPPFYGRAAAESSLAFRLEGTLASGTSVVDEAAVVRFHPDAAPGWDALDASKLTPPGTAQALLAPVLLAEGAPRRASITALPLESTSIPLAFAASEAGTFVVMWTTTLPPGVAGSLRDLETGAVTDLAVGSYSFSAPASDWAERFEIAVTAGGVAGEPGASGRVEVGEVRPNPVHDAPARLRIAVPAGQSVTVRLFDVVGRQVADAFHGPLPTGVHEVELPTQGLAAGTYLVRVESDSQVAVRRLTIWR